jgi:hypothetical protein
VTSRRLTKKLVDRDSKDRRKRRESVAGRASDPVLPVGDGCLVDTEVLGEGLLREAAHLAKRGNAPVDRAVQPLPSLLFHADIVDRNSTLSQERPNPVLPNAMQLSVDVGDARHKKSDPGAEDDPVTDAWRDAVRARLEQNRHVNERAGVGRRAPDREIDDYASLARAVDTDTTMITNILGPVRASSQPKDLVERSKFVGPISRALGIPYVPSSRLDEAFARMRMLDESALEIVERQIALLEQATRRPRK